jgi:hypothetical protein
MAKRKVQKDKQRSTKHTYKAKDRVTRTALKTGGEPQSSLISWPGPQLQNVFLMTLLMINGTETDTCYNMKMSVNSHDGCH